MFETAIGLSKRNEEKKAVLAMLPKYPYPQAMAGKSLSVRTRLLQIRDKRP
ncbi:MAG: hypothetical protein OEW48_00835 [Phycisphaerae bacterium]|nr:hypothetical protein [Phycisphaerae bacterium]